MEKCVRVCVKWVGANNGDKKAQEFMGFAWFQLSTAFTYYN